MEATKRVVITPPEVTVSTDGKILPVVHVAICEVLMVDGAQFGKSRPHRAVLAMQPDGSWEFEPAPVHPESGLPFTFSDADKAAWNAMLDTYEERYGVVSRGYVTDVNEKAATMNVVEYVQRNDGCFDRTVRTQELPTAFDGLNEALTALVPKLGAPQCRYIGEHILAVIKSLADAKAAEAAIAE